MRTAEEARREPKAGDVFTKGGGTCVIHRTGVNELCYNWDGPWNYTPPMVHWSQNWVPAWRKWAETAEVLKVAE